MNRQSRRYLALRIASDPPPTGEKLFDEIKNSLRRLFGEYGVLKASPRLIAYDAEKMIGIVRCSHLWVERFRAALALTTRIEEHRAALFIFRSAGTVAALRRSFPVNDDLRDKRMARSPPSDTIRYSR